MGMQSFKDSMAWQKAMDLTELIDAALEKSRHWGYKDQLFRAALSVCNNLAEGFEMPTNPHQIKYLWIAKGSCNEVLSMLILAGRRGYFAAEQLGQMMILQDEVARLIRTYIDNKTKRWARIPGGRTLFLAWLALSTVTVVR
jgi:four helix bundle protein